jgi:hypothetical protein
LKKCLDNKYIIIKEIIKENANELLSTTWRQRKQKNGFL